MNDKLFFSFERYFGNVRRKSDTDAKSYKV